MTTLSGIKRILRLDRQLEDIRVLGPDAVLNPDPDDEGEKALEHMQKGIKAWNEDSAKVPRPLGVTPQE